MSAQIFHVENPLNAQMWVDWQRPEVDRCTHHGVQIMQVHAVGPAAEIARLPIGSVWHMSDLVPAEQAMYKGERFIEPCEVPE